jgi:hypothetical protein
MFLPEEAGERGERRALGWGRIILVVLLHHSPHPHRGQRMAVGWMDQGLSFVMLRLSNFFLFYHDDISWAGFGRMTGSTA